jgi:Subtilase family
MCHLQADGILPQGRRSQRAAARFTSRQGVTVGHRLLAKLAAVAVGGVIVVLLVASGGVAANGPSRDSSTILVKFTSAAHEASAIAAEGDRHVGDTPTHVAVVDIRGADVDAKVAAYGARSDVVYAEPNYIAHAYLASPSDPSFSSQWAYSKIQAVSGWSIYPNAYVSSGGATLAVVDTGVEASHPDLAGRAQTASGATCLSGTCVAGPATDDNGHGTHVAGIAGATTNNATGVAGTSFSSPIIPVKVLDSTGSGTYASVASGILWAAQHGARVMNLSLGGPSYSQTLCDAVATATNTYKVLVVAAAGNSNSSAPSYPAACPGAVGVAATDSNDARASFSNYGSPDVFVSAPGIGILSTYLGGTYRTLSGTSMATPFVTGLAALLIGQNSASSPTTIKQRLAQTSDKIGGVTYGSDPYGTCTGCTWSSSFGYGRINVYRALSAGAPAPAPDFAISATPATATVTAGGAASYTVSITGKNGFASSVSLGVSGLPAGASASFTPNPTTSSSTLTVTTSASTPSSTSTLTITGTSGSLTHSASVQLAVQTTATPDFSLGMSPTSQAVDLGNSVDYSISITGSGGFTGAVSLSASGLPSATSASFSPNPGTTSSTLTISTSVMAAVGTYTITITGTSGTLTHTASVTLAIRSNYALFGAPASQTVAPGGSASYTVTITRYGGFAGLVNLSASGLPAGATAAFNPNPAGGSSAVVTVTTATTTPPGTYTITITGVAGSRMLTHTATVTLVVT